MRFEMFDVIYARINVPDGDHIQKKARPFIVCQNELGCINAPTLIVMPLTNQIKKMDMPTHTIIKKREENGLRDDSMVLAEQIFTIDKKAVITKFGHIYNEKEQANICECYLANLYGKKKIKVNVVEG